MYVIEISRMYYRINHSCRNIHLCHYFKCLKCKALIESDEYTIDGAKALQKCLQDLEDAVEISQAEFNTLLGV